MKNSTEPTIKDVLDVLGSFDARFDRVENKIGGLETKVDSVESKVGGLEGKIDGVEGKIGGLESRIDGVEISLEASIKAQIIKSQDETAELIKDVLTLTDTRFNKVESQLDEVIAGAKVINLQLKNVDLKADNLDLRLGHLESAA